MDEVKKRLMNAIAESKMSYAAIAELVGIHRKRVERHASGKYKNPLSDAIIRNYEQALGMRIDDRHEPAHAPKCLIRGWLLDSCPTFRTVSEDYRRNMNGRVPVPTKYLFCHRDSSEHYATLQRAASYSIWRQSDELFRDAVLKVAERIANELRETAKGAPECALVALGVGEGAKELTLAEKLADLGVKVHFVAVDFHQGMLLKAYDAYYRRRARGPGAASFEFVLADFDTTDVVSEICSVIRSPVVFTLLGGTIGNQHEIPLIKSIRRAKDCCTLIFDYEVRAEGMAPYGYDSNENLQWYAAAVKAIADRAIDVEKDVRARPVTGADTLRYSNVPSAEVVVMEVREKVDNQSDNSVWGAFGWSTRYDDSAFRTFLEQQGCSDLVVERAGEERVRIACCKLTNDRSVEA